MSFFHNTLRRLVLVVGVVVPGIVVRVEPGHVVDFVSVIEVEGGGGSIAHDDVERLCARKKER